MIGAFRSTVNAEPVTLEGAAWTACEDASGFSLTHPALPLHLYSCTPGAEEGQPCRSCHEEGQDGISVPQSCRILCTCPLGTAENGSHYLPHGGRCVGVHDPPVIRQEPER